MLSELCEFVDEIVVVDDASTDRTPDIVLRCPKVVKLVQSPEPLFAQEWKLRSLLWETAVSTDPDWLLSIDADELYEAKARRSMRTLIDQDRYDWVAFRFFDLWGGTTHYREDELWNIHRRHQMTLVRYMPRLPCPYPKLDHHLPRIPPTYHALPGLLSELRVKHLGWAGDWADRVRKYRRYKANDPEGRFGSLDHYESILDPEPNLIPWREDAE